MPLVEQSSEFGKDNSDEFHETLVQNGQGDVVVVCVVRAIAEAVAATNATIGENNIFAAMLDDDVNIVLGTFLVNATTSAKCFDDGVDGLALFAEITPSGEVVAVFELELEAVELFGLKG